MPVADISAHIRFHEALRDMSASDAKVAAKYIPSSAVDAVGKHVIDGKYTDAAQSVVRAQRAALKAAHANHKGHASGPDDIDKATLNRLAARYPTFAAFLNTRSAYAVTRSIFTENAAKLRGIADTHTKDAGTAFKSAENAHNQLHKALADILGRSEAEKYIPKKFSPTRYYKEGDRHDFPAGLSGKLTDLAERDLKALHSKVQSNLERELTSKEAAQKALDHADINDMLVDTQRHWLTRTPSFYISPAIRAQGMFWLNLVGMLTMVATLPLMYVGLKQWVDSLHAQPQDAGGGGQ